MVRYYVGARYGTRYTYTTAYTPYFMVGRPYELPFYETSDGSQLKYFWITGGDAQWQLYTDASDIKSVDGDGSFFWMKGSYQEDQGHLTSGKIRPTGRDIELELSYMALQNDSNLLSVNVLCDGVGTTLRTIPMFENGTDDWTWQTVRFNLDEYKDKVIQVQLLGTLWTHVSIFVDGIKITSTPDTEPGDVNGDGAVDVEDVNALINVILDLTLPDNLAGNADVNGDGVTDIEDVNALINLILTQ